MTKERARRSFRGVGVLVALTILASCSLRWPLRAGDRAPELAVTDWLQGEPPAAFGDDGPIVLVELWATWCGPCQGTIPFLDELQRRYAAHGVRVVAVAVQDRLDNVRRFVAERGGELAYDIAFDGDGRVWDEWRAAWFERWVPLTFLIGRDGRVLGLSHPLYADEQVSRLLAGQWQTPARQRMEPHWDELRAAKEGEDWATIERIADEAIDASASDSVGWIWKLTAQRDPDRVAAVGRSAIAAVASSPLHLGLLVTALAGQQHLDGCAEQAHAALQAVRVPPPGLAFSGARLHAAAAVGDPAALPQVVAELGATFAGQPHERVAIAREVASRTLEVRTEVGPEATRRRLLDALLPLLDDSTEGCRLRLEIVFEIEAGQARIDAAGRQLIGRLSGDVSELNDLAWSLLSDERRLARSRGVALAAATAMQAIEGWDTPAHLDTLALALFENGDIDGAIRMQERAIESLGEQAGKSYRDRLARYRAR